MFWGCLWECGARAAGARAPGRSPGPRWPALVWAVGGRAVASARAAWPGALRAFLGALVRGFPARVLAANHSGRVGPDTPFFFDKCQPGVYYPHGDIITPSWILCDPPVGIMRRRLTSLYDPHI